MSTVMEDPVNARDMETRRIGTRVPLESTPAVIEVPGGRLRRKLVKAEVRILNASVTGVGFLAQLATDLPVGTVTQLELGDLHSRIRIRQASPAGLGRGTYYGAEFLDPWPTVVPALQDIINGGDPNENDIRWNTDNIR